MWGAPGVSLRVQSLILTERFRAKFSNVLCTRSSSLFYVLCPGAGRAPDVGTLQEQRQLAVVIDAVEGRKAANALRNESHREPERLRMTMTCLVKKENKKKYNSHHWFMAAFAKELRCKYIFCTDCATVYNKNM
jgi:cellulose synthase/poly-beta-1,6-N-acetylglucosamine synthase-like glycosyltransferase